MLAVTTAFPTLEALRASSPADLGLAALRGMIETEDHQLRNRINPTLPPFTMTHKSLVADILSGITGQQEAPIAAEAISWLITHDLVAMMAKPGEVVATADILFTTRLGREVNKLALTSTAGIAVSLRAVDLLPVSLRQAVTTPLLAGNFDLAVTAACKAVEIRMRERAGLPTSDFGSRLARKFFAAASGTSLGRSAQAGITDEQHFFEGIFGLYRDRAVHETPHIDSAEYALEVIIATAHLLRLVEAATPKAAASGAAAAPTV